MKKLRRKIWITYREIEGYAFSKITKVIKTFKKKISWIKCRNRSRARKGKE